jgi:heat shock protein HslJ
VAGTTVRLDFADGSLGASAGCNSMGGAYQLDGDVLRIPDGLAMTEMGCEPDLMAQDEWLAGLITGEPTLALDGDTLVLTAGSTVLTLLDREVADPDRAVVGTTWVLDGIIDGDAVSSVPGGVRATLRIEEQPDGSLVAAVEDGCNSGSGPVEVAETTMSFGNRMTTLIGCEGDQAAVADAVLAVLQGEVEYQVEAASLTLDAGDQGLTYRAKD